MPSPTFPMSSYLTGNSPLSSHSSSSSTLSESSNSISTPLFISTKRSRGPRKRPNQCSAEAAALLSSIYPKLFCVNNQHLSTSHLQQPPDDPFPLLLPSFPISNDANLHLPSPTNSSKPTRPIHTTTDFHFQDPGSPDFDAESILDEEVEEGIDSIMGNLSMTKETNLDCLTSNSIINPFGVGFGISSSIRGAFRHSNDGEWWRSPKVAVNDILPTPLTVNPNKISDKKKKKKKKKNKTMVENDGDMKRKVFQPEDGILKAKLGLKLNYQGIIKEWTGGSPFSADTGLPCSAADLIASLADIDESRDGAMREASVQRYKEKRRNRFFSKKIRYEVRKTNANHRPRMKGRFVRGPLLLEAMAEGSHEKA